MCIGAANMHVARSSCRLVCGCYHNHCYCKSLPAKIFGTTVHRARAPMFARTAHVHSICWKSSDFLIIKRKTITRTCWNENAEVSQSWLTILLIFVVQSVTIYVHALFQVIKQIAGIKLSAVICTGHERESVWRVVNFMARFARSAQHTSFVCTKHQ